MECLSLNDVWTRFKEEKDGVQFKDFVQRFITKYKDFIDLDFSCCRSDIIYGIGPYLRQLPIGVVDAFIQEVDVIHRYFHKTFARHEFGEADLGYLRDVIKCLIILCRNPESVLFVVKVQGNIDVTHYVLSISKSLIGQLSYEEENEMKEDVTFREEVLSFLHHAIHLLECMYDPYVIWAKKLKGEDLQTFQSGIQSGNTASLHNEVIPFFIDCFERRTLPVEIQLYLVRLFGAIISGNQDNALKAITPASLGAVLKILPICTARNRTDAHRLKTMARLCLTAMVHVLYRADEGCQVNIPNIVRGYLDVLRQVGCRQRHGAANEVDATPSGMLIDLVGAMCDMLSCPNRMDLQYIFVSEDTFEVLILILLQTSLTGQEAQDLASCVLRVTRSILSGSVKVKESFFARPGYKRLFEALKCLGPPSPSLLRVALDLVVEDEFREQRSRKLRNIDAALSLMKWLPDIQSHDVQTWLSQMLCGLCSENNHNHRVCSTGGMISVIIETLHRHSLINPNAIANLINLLEALGTLAIKPEELKQLIGLFKYDVDGKPNPYMTQLMQMIGTMTRHNNENTPLHYLCIYLPSNGLVMRKDIRYPKDLSVHIWVCLTQNIDLNKQNVSSEKSYRRQLYSISTDEMCGFEAFFIPDLTLVVAAYNKKTYTTCTVYDEAFRDQEWHCIDIVHKSGISIFTHSTVTIYIDGREKAVAQMSYPSSSKPLSLLKIGSPGIRHFFALDSPSGKQQSSHSKRRIQKQKSVDVAINNQPYGLKEDLWGCPIAICGQVTSACIFSTALSHANVQHLYSIGVGCKDMFIDDDLSDGRSKLIFYFHAAACNGRKFWDLSPLQNDGSAAGKVCEMRDIKEVINCVGGVQVLFPLLEIIKDVSPEIDCHPLLAHPSGARGVSVAGAERSLVAMLPDSPTGNIVQNNQVAVFLILLRNFLQTSAVNQDSFICGNGCAIIGALLQEIPQSRIDVNVLVAVQSLVEAVGPANERILNGLYQFILFDFRLWSGSDFATRIGHINYVHLLIKEQMEFFRSWYGVQYILDVIRTFYSSIQTCNLNENDAKTIRDSLLGLIKFYTMNGATASELKQILSFLMVVKETTLIDEVLDMMLHVLKRPRKRDDQLLSLMLKPNMADHLYTQLTHHEYSTKLKEKVLKIMLILMRAENIPEAEKQHLKLIDIGYSGLVNQLFGSDVSATMIRLLLEMATLTDVPHSYNSMLAVLQLVTYAPVTVKLECSRQVLSILKSQTHPNACRLVAQELGWQETICNLFVLKKLEVLSSEQDVNPYFQFRFEFDKEKLDEKPYSSSNSPVLRNSSSCQSFSALPMTPIYITARAVGAIPISISDYVMVEKTEQMSSCAANMISRDQGPEGENEDEADHVFTMDDIEQGLEDIDDRADDSGTRVAGDSAVNDEKDRQELCQNLLVILLEIMWKGVQGPVNAIWKERGEVCTCLMRVSAYHELVRPLNELKRSLIEFMLDACTADIRDAGGQTTSIHSENSLRLVKLTYNYLCQDMDDNEGRYSERLIEELLALFDVLSIWSEKAVEWTEMWNLGLAILLSFIQNPNFELCSRASSSIITITSRRKFMERADVCFLLGSLNSPILQSLYDNSDNYMVIITTLRNVLKQNDKLLNIEEHLSKLPDINNSQDFNQNFRIYCHSDEWKRFMETIVMPHLELFKEVNLAAANVSMAIFWSDCHELMTKTLHSRNNQEGNKKLNFQNNILEPSNNCANHEQRRFNNVMTQLRNQRTSVLKHWRATKRFFTSERGAWAHRYPLAMHWQITKHLTFSQKRMKMGPNPNFDSHTTASQRRDDHGINSAITGEQLQQDLQEAKVPSEKINDDAITDEDWDVISPGSMPDSRVTDKENPVLSVDCDLVTLAMVVKGRLEISTKHIYFFAVISSEGSEDFKIALSQLREIHFRCYNLRRSALEMFLINQWSYFLNFEKKVRNKVYANILRLRPSNLFYRGTRSPRELLEQSELTGKWVNRDISNFEYLMQLNTIAGRTYNDLSQYPVFPWILSDYTSETLDLENPKIYRDLSKPIGVISPRNEGIIREKYDLSCDPGGLGEKFHYGSHYSAPAHVLHYMVRVEPFTSLHIQLFGGIFDKADRQFLSIAQSWNSLKYQQGDVKELIPELFYLPECLVNSNHYDFGQLQISHEQVNDVKIPPWASSPEDFIYKHRQALESEHVSANLNHWIDLIFGYKQRGDEAVNALNVFMYYTYEGMVDLDKFTDPIQREIFESAINNFGQTPIQLFKRPHPNRLGKVTAAKNRRLVNLLSCEHQLSSHFVEMEAKPVSFVCVPRNQFISPLQNGMPIKMVTVSNDGILGYHDWLPYGSILSNLFTLILDPSLSQPPKNRRYIGGPFAPGLAITQNLFAVSHDAKVMFSGGHWDNSIQVYGIERGSKLCHMIRHTDVVTCLALDYCGSHLITGSRDTTCLVWQLQRKTHELSSKPVQTLFGHDDEITAVQISINLDMAVSAAKDGTMIIHTVQKGRFMYTLTPPHIQPILSMPLLAISDTGHIILYCEEKSQDKTNKEVSPSLHLYTINGKHLQQERLKYPVGHFAIADDKLVLGTKKGHLQFREIFGFREIKAIDLKQPILCLTVTKDSTNILIGLDTGQEKSLLIIVGTKTTETK